MPEEKVYASRRLRHESRSINYLLPEHGEAKRVSAGRFEVSENYTPPVSIDGKFGRYHLVIETDVFVEDDLWSVQDAARYLQDELDVCWIYAVGVPLFFRSFSIEHPVTNPRWTNNVKEVYKELQRLRGQRALTMKMSITPRHSDVVQHEFPLAAAGRVLHAYHAADQNVRTLMDLHYRALGDLGNTAELFLLSNGLELARELLLQGRPQNEQASYIDRKIPEPLTHPSGWLFTIANRRLYTRHVVATKEPLSLHAVLTDSERKDFIADADKVLRFVVCEKLGVPFVEIEKK